MDKATFEPPSPGAWELEATHLQRPVTRWLADIFATNMVAGFKEGTARYGALLDHLEVAVINGFIYLAPRPVGAPKKAKGPPPKLIFKLLTKLHPEIRRRIKRSREVFEGKLWREDVVRWDTEWKPAAMKRNAELAAIDPSKLDAPQLIAHLAQLEERVADSIHRHHALNMCALLPVGDFLVHVTQWTGKAVHEICPLLRGASPVSAGATAELERASAAIRSDADAARMLASSAPAGDIVAKLRAHGGDVGAAVEAYVSEVAYRMPGGHDLSEPCTIELPEIIVNALRTGARHEHDAARVAADTAAMREAVPAEHRAEFDALLAEALLVYRIRDERTCLNDLVAIGLARRALLAAGDKLVAGGKLEHRDHVVDLAPAELRALLAGKPGPNAAEVAGRVAYRVGHSVADAPARLGFPPSPPPPAEWLPPYAARAMRSVGIVLHAMFEVPETKPEPKVVRGLAASPGTYEGRARVVLGAEQFSNVQQGDVLIARTTCPSYNILLPLLGGIVTDRGGLLSHAAIVAREYGMPAVVGTSDATKLITDGARVRVDGATGIVQVLS
jgi:pyruvate,water dikinase